MGGPANRLKVTRTEMYADGEITESTFRAAFSDETERIRDTLIGRLQQATQSLGWPDVELFNEFHEAPRAPEEPGGYAERQTVGVLSRLASAAGLDYLGAGRPQHLHPDEFQTGVTREHAAQAALVRDVFGNPFRPVAFHRSWRTDTAVSLARTMYEERDFSAMPILADALQDAGCDNDDTLNHCRGNGPHVRGCWAVDLVLGKA
jgi:hypothetical protein